MSQKQHLFSQVPQVEIPRSSFNRSSGVKTTLNAGYLVPFYVDEALPGDTFNMRVSAFGRFATLLHPFMDNVYMDFFFFFVPHRLVWTNFKRMMGEQDNPNDTTSYVVPTITSPAGGYLEESIYDYMGIPTKVVGLTHSALPLRAYNLVWNQWFRDQNLQNSLQVLNGDGPDAPGYYGVVRRGKRHDYFTSCLPWPQKGPAVQLPLGSTAPVKTGTVVQQTGGGTPMRLAKYTDGQYPVANTNYLFGGAGNGNLYESTGAATAGSMAFYPNNLYADLSTATAATINQLRQAFQIQRIYERDARGGTRYTELVLSHFGVHSPDARLQRPEYLGGGSCPLNVNPIAQTSNVAGSPSPQGNLAAMATVSTGGVGFTQSFTEHGTLLGLVSVRADLSYQQGLNRMWSRSTRFDFYWPALAHIGEQGVLNKEIYAVGTAIAGQDNLVFGYQERYGEYRYMPSLITGKMRSNAAQPLDTWHLAQQFGVVPALGDAFIQENPPVQRIIAVTTEPHLILDLHMNLKCARPMPVYGVPGNIDRF